MRWFFITRRGWDERTKRINGVDKEYQVIKVEEKVENKITYKCIHVIKKTRKEKCPYCGSYTKSIQDKLKPVKLKYLKSFEYITYLLIIKRRFICHKCNKKFTEKVNLNNSNESLSNKLKQEILKDLLNYNLSLKYINWNAYENNISDNTVRNILVDAMSDYPKQVRLLPSVVSFDEFKADTKMGKYALIMNDLLHKKVINVLPSRKIRI